MNNFAGDVLNSAIGPLLKQLIFNPSQPTSLQSKFDSLPKTKFPLYEGSYPTYPSGPLEGSYPQRDGGVFSDPFPNIRTMEFRDANSNGVDDRDETSGLLRIDPAVESAMRIQKAQMDAGISGTFLPVEY